MKREAALYVLIPVLMVVLAYGMHLAKRSAPQEVEAQTFLIEKPSGAAIDRPDVPIVVRKSTDSEQVMELPESEQSLITGQCTLDSGSYFSGWITNGSSWTVTELRLRIAAGHSEGSTRWERNYNERVKLPPRTAGRISFKVTDGRDAETRWKVISARGIPSS